MWSSSTTTMKVQGSSSKRKPFSRWVPGPKSSHRINRIGFRCILQMGPNSWNFPGDLSLQKLQLDVKIYGVFYWNVDIFPSSRFWEFPILMTCQHVIIPSSLIFNKVAGCRKLGGEISIKSPFRNLIGFTSAVEHIGNAHVDLLGCKPGNKAPKKVAMLLKSFEHLSVPVNVNTAQNSPRRGAWFPLTRSRDYDDVVIQTNTNLTAGNLSSSFLSIHEKIFSTKYH